MAFGDNILDSNVNFLKYVKLVKLAMVQVVGRVEDERCSSTLTLMKFKFNNRLTIHLPFMACLCNIFLIYITSHTKSALRSGEVPTTGIVMMAKV